MTKLNFCTINEYITYKNYYDQFKKLAAVDDINLLNDNDKKFYGYRKINFQRSSRIEKTFEPADETKDVFSKINKPQQWIVITESWCGDSAQSLPIIVKLANLNDKVDLKILLRDSNLDYMELYLTNGARAIPKLVVYDENSSELFNWGPRPEKAKDLFAKLKNNGVEKIEIYKQLHLWYGKDRGKEIEQEIVNELKKIV
jgi:hypothetical protein